MTSGLGATEDIKERVREALMRVAAELQRARKQKGMTQQELADAAGLSVVTLSKIEVQQNVPSMETFIALAYALELSPNRLLGWTELSKLPSNREREVARLVEAANRLETDWISILADLALKADGA